MATNDVTGDKLVSKVGNSKAFADNYDAIFRKGKQYEAVVEQPGEAVPAEEDVKVGGELWTNGGQDSQQGWN